MARSYSSSVGRNGVHIELWGWETFFSELGRFLESSGRNYSTANEAYATYVLERLEVCIISLNAIKLNLQQLRTETLTVYRDHVEQILSICRTLSVKWEQKIDAINMPDRISFRPALLRSTRGRPRFNISKEQLLYLCSLSFSWSDIAKMLGVSRMTIYRRRVEYRLTEDPRIVPTDAQLHTVVSDIQAGQPEIGEVMIMGRIRSMGYKVSRQRLRQEIRNSDPLHVALRWRGGLTSRHPYSVPGPNSLWHIDGHHKLIRWNFVVHAGIDGSSRMIVFLHCSNNNRASTVYDLFLKAVQSYGLPSRVRSDQGGENVMVARHMIHHRGAHRNSMLVGSSVHNQRIERLWRDLFRCAIQLYYRLFYFLEDEDKLLPSNHQHIYALHYVYLPRINQTLKHFCDGWNNHGIRTEGNKSPFQLYTEGILQLRHSGRSEVDFFDHVDSSYGTVEQGLVAEDDGIQVPDCDFSLAEEHYIELQQVVDPLQSSDNYGIELYEQTLGFITLVVGQNPTVYQ